LNEFSFWIILFYGVRMAEKALRKRAGKKKGAGVGAKN
jgi:hypothetical protein